MTLCPPWKSWLLPGPLVCPICPGPVGGRRGALQVPGQAGHLFPWDRDGLREAPQSTCDWVALAECSEGEDQVPLSRTLRGQRTGGLPAIHRVPTAGPGLGVRTGYLFPRWPLGGCSRRQHGPLTRGCLPPLGQALCEGLRGHQCVGGVPWGEWRGQQGAVWGAGACMCMCSRHAVHTCVLCLLLAAPQCVSPAHRLKPEPRDYGIGGSGDHQVMRPGGGAL